MGLFSKDTSDWLDGTAAVLAEHPTNTYYYGPHDLEFEAEKAKILGST